MTAAARDGLEAIHDREPSMLTPDVSRTWLDPALTAAGDAVALLSRPAPELSWYEVGTAVGSVRNDGAHLLDPV